MRTMEISDIQHLAKLSRIKISDEEAGHIKKDIESVLDYVSVVNDITADAGITKKVGAVYNVFRPDEVKNETGGETETLLAEAPERDGNYLKVKKILNTD